MEIRLRMVLNMLRDAESTCVVEGEGLNVFVVNGRPLAVEAYGKFGRQALEANPPVSRAEIKRVKLDKIIDEIKGETIFSEKVRAKLIEGLISYFSQSERRLIAEINGYVVIYDGGKPAVALNVNEEKWMPGLPDLTSKEEVKITAYRVKKEYAERLIL